MSKYLNSSKQFIFDGLRMQLFLPLDLLTPELLPSSLLQDLPSVYTDRLMDSKGGQEERVQEEGGGVVS